MRKAIDWGLEYGFVNKDGWHDMCWYAENGYKELPHFIKQYFAWLFKKNVYFKLNINNKPIFLRK